MHKNSVLLRLRPLLAFVLTAAAAFGASAREPVAPDSRLILTRTAAERAGLHQVGLDFRDLYGVIHAESSWVARDGLGKNGVVSQGVAQFEPATARAVGLRDPNDVTASVHAAARLLKEAAEWSADRIARLSLTPQQRAAKLREGVSIYYNLSSRGRSAWNGLNTHQLPVETQRHIRNVHAGALQAEKLLAGVAGGPKLAPLPALALSASAGAGPDRGGRVPARAETARPLKPAKPQPLGTIEWAGKPADGSAARKYVVWSNGAVQRDDGRELPPGAVTWTRRS
jgi:hypothetical protein